MKINGFISTIMLIALLLIATFGGITHAENEEDWIPDPNLRQVISEKLGVKTLTIADMPRLNGLVVDGGEALYGLNVDLNEVRSLAGLEHATNLEFLAIVHAKVSDLKPLAGLENLRVLKLYNNRIPDITPLTGLINLEVLQLQVNQISDISPLAGLAKLQELNLEDNLLTDISSLQALVNLKTLHLGGNQILDFTPIYGLVGIKLLTLGDIPLDSEVLQILNTPDNVICDVEDEPILPHIEILPRIENREYPSIFQACQDIINLPKLSRVERATYHDLFFCGAVFGAQWKQTLDGIRPVGVLEDIRRHVKEIRERNPNMLLLMGVDYYAASFNTFPEDSPHWFRDASGNRVEVEGWDQRVMDFTHPAVQNMVIQQASAVARCGIFDGIVIDHWTKEEIEGNPRYRTFEEIDTARERIMQGIRDAVGEDFLILIIVTDIKIPKWAADINGIFMETIEDYEGGYTYAGLSHIESTLLWSEENLREPQINCLAGRGVRSEPLDSPRNLQWMRLFTTMSLTHSDGYVLFTVGSSLDHSHPYEMWPGHADEHAQGKRHAHQQQHYWYRFWEADLGQPVGGDETKGQFYENREGLFIREFTNGWAVYNRSGTAQEIELPQEVSGWSSGVENQRRHTLADLDGEIYLKAESGLETPPTVDVNEDGVVNVLDLIMVTQHIGREAPNNPRMDVNGDGVVNILDLVVVANAFDQ